MYKVFLVDDEIVIREGIRNGFPWDESRFTLCGEAPDGEMAYSMICDLKPDILITDIRMPFMDGLALSRKVMQTLPWTNIIILSGYDDFLYAQEAISIGVKQYLLKPVTPKKLAQALESMAEKICADQARQADTEMLQSKQASSERAARERMITKLLEGKTEWSSQEEAQALSMPLDASKYLVMMMGSVPIQDRPGLFGYLHRLSDGQAGSVLCTMALDNPVLLLLARNEPGHEDLEERAYALAQALEYEAGKKGLSLPAIAIGSPVSRLQDLPRALMSARAVLHAMAGKPTRIMGSLDADLSATLEITEGSKLPLYERMLYAPQKEGDGLVDGYFRSMGDPAAHSLLVLNYLLMDVLLAASRVIRKCGGEPAAVLPARLFQQSELIKLAQHPQEALSAGQEMTACALLFRDQNAISRYGETLRMAMDYIECNFHRTDMALHDVAGHVALSDNHFSTVFSQEMGMTFTEYVTRIRLEKAKQLLGSTAERSVEIAAAIGYSDPHYFSYLFKKQVGMSPRDFRKSLTLDQ